MPDSDAPSDHNPGSQLDPDPERDRYELRVQYYDLLDECLSLAYSRKHRLFHPLAHSISQANLDSILELIHPGRRPRDPEHRG